MSNVYKINLYNFIQHFPNETTCYNLLVSKKWLNGPICPYCESYNVTKMKNKQYSYRCNNCNKDFSILSNTIMENSHIPLQKWFLAILLMSRDKRGVSALELARDLDISKEAARNMSLNIKAAMAKRESQYMLSGDIEMDEFYIGAPKGKPGRGTKKTPVIIAISFEDEYNEEKDKTIRLPKYIKLQALEPGSLSTEKIESFATNNIELGSSIYTDGSNLYFSLESIGYNLISNKFNIETNPLSFVHTATSNCKSYLQGTYHGSYKENVQLFLDEFAYRYNRRNIHSNIFERICEISVTTNKSFRSRNYTAN